MQDSTRRTIRTMFQFGVTLAAFLPVWMEASGFAQRGGAVGYGLTIAGAITRLMALPQTDRLLEILHLSWLMKEESPPGRHRVPSS